MPNARHAFYAGTFPNGTVTAQRYAPSDYLAGAEDDTLTVNSHSAGVDCVGINNGAIFKRREAFSGLCEVTLIRRRRIRLRPEFNKVIDLAAGDGKEGDRLRSLCSIGDRDGRDGLGLAANKPIDSEAPWVTSQVLGIHSSKVFGASNTSL